MLVAAASGWVIDEFGYGVHYVVLDAPARITATVRVNERVRTEEPV
ncbi:hypothetical protein GCM10009609_06230 [Pseudonocardia aurantiaca]|uniref:Uncharacterized protein n=1 Tax=Pseudonocardia aurantiaca TaxID=75290 RepID=A0ABW4FLC2_9PSEU